jgi:hypothetical protein
MHRQS